MDHARGCPNLRVVMRVGVIHQEIDQSAPCLQHCQKADDLAVSLVRSGRNGYRSGCLNGGASSIPCRAALDHDRNQRD